MPEPAVNNKTEEKTDIIKEARDWYTYVKNHPYEKKYREDAESKVKYFTGEDQGWDEFGDRAKLEAEKRPALTLNRIQPIFRMICGARPKIETTYLPTKTNTSEVAQILESCKDHIEDINHFSYMEDDLFKKGAITDRACIALWPNYRRDIRGEVEIEECDGYCAYPDPDAVKKDRSDGMRFVYVKDVSKEEAIRLFPKFKKDIENFLDNYKESAAPNTAKDTDAVDRYKDSASDYYNADTKKLSLVYYWWKTFDKATKIVHKATGKVTDSAQKKEDVDKRLQELGATDKFTAIEREFTRVHYIIYCNDILLEEGITPWERPDGQRTWLSDNFPYLIWEPDRLITGSRQELISLMTSMEDPQKYHNKLASAIIHIINSQAKSGYDYEKGAISEPNKRKLEESGSKPGVNIEWENGAITGGKFKQRTPANMASGEIAAAAQMGRAILDVSGSQGLSPDPVGANAPGMVRQMKANEGAAAVSWIYRSFSFFLHIYAEAVKDAIQRMYDYDKVIRIRGAKAKTIRINEAVYSQQGAIEKVLNDVNSDDFDTQTREKQEQPTIRLERLKYFSELIKSGQLQLPPQVLTKVILELMDDPDLRDLIEEEFARFIEEQKINQLNAMGGGQMPPAVAMGGQG